MEHSHKGAYYYYFVCISGSSDRMQIIKNVMLPSEWIKINVVYGAPPGELIKCMACDADDSPRGAAT